MLASLIINEPLYKTGPRTPMETGSFDRLIAKSRIIQGCKHGRAILHNYGVRTVSPWSDVGMHDAGVRNY